MIVATSAPGHTQVHGIVPLGTAKYVMQSAFTVGSTLTVLWPDDRPDICDRLTAAGVATLPWWGPGCHAHPAYRDCPAERLPVTSIYARRAIGLPFWQDLDETQIASVCDALTQTLHRPALRKRAAARSLVPA